MPAQPCPVSAPRGKLSNGSRAVLSDVRLQQSAVGVEACRVDGVLAAVEHSRGVVRGAEGEPGRAVFRP